MYVGYAAFMLCRNTLGAASPMMMEDAALAMGKPEYGRLLSWASAGAIIGKLVTGIGADILGGRKMFLIALSLTALANLGFAFSTSLVALGVFNFLGQAFKAGGWPAMVKIVGEWYPQRRSGQVWSIISTSSRVGTIAAGLVLGFLLAMISWRAVFIVSAVITGLVVILAFFFLKDRPEDVGLDPLPDDSTGKLGDGEKLPAASHPFDDLNVRQVCWRFIASGRFWMIGLSICFLCILMEFINFIPIYLTESMGIASEKASMAGSAFPAGMFAALVATSMVYDRLNKRRLIYVLGGLLAVGCLCVVALWNFASLPIPTSMQVPAAIGLIFLMGFSLSPAYYIPMSVFSVSFGGKHGGFLVALIDVFGYAGAMLFNYFGGSIAEDYGWSVFLIGLLSIAVAALLSMTTFLTLDYRASRSLGR